VVYWEVESALKFANYIGVGDGLLGIIWVGEFGRLDPLQVKGADFVHEILCLSLLPEFLAKSLFIQVGKKPKKTIEKS
jgi:hypothetical protein